MLFAAFNCSCYFSSPLYTCHYLIWRYFSESASLFLSYYALACETNMVATGWVVLAPIHAYPIHFQKKKNHQNPEHSIIFWNTSQTYPHIYEINPAARFNGKITGQSTLPIPHSWEHCFSRSRLLSASPIISWQRQELQSSRKHHLSCQQWWKATSPGMLS